MSSRQPFTGRRSYSVSQNYLTSGRLIERLLDRTSITHNDLVVEIGAGKGHITRALLPRCDTLRAVEIDPALHRTLVSQWHGNPRLQLICGDFLKRPLPPAPYKVFANIPFSITTAIMRKLTTAPNPPEECWLVMEKGAARRFMGFPRESVDSLALKPYFHTEIIHHFRREDFHPMPSVDVVLLHLLKKATYDLPYSRRAEFAGFVRQCIAYGLRAALTPKQIAVACKKSGQPIPAGGEIMYIQWLCLFRSYAQCR